MEDKNKKLILIVGAIVGIVVVLSIVIGISDVFSEPVEIIKLNENLHSAKYSSGITYYYAIKGQVINIHNSKSGDYLLEVEFYDDNGKIVDKDTKNLYDRSSSGKNDFLILSKHKTKINMSKVELRVIDAGGNIVANVTYNINMHLMKEPTDYTSTSSTPTQNSSNTNTQKEGTSSSSSSGGGKTTKISKSGDYYYSGTHMIVTLANSQVSHSILASGTYYLSAGDTVELINGDLTFKGS